ncbi:UbiA prenyltransferase [Artomyces pyxidatus]|uniref:UbiA prenyltransferase n=1 Tax=Artomyces pyxidatus TaxID=48021 RepID=A0ACB8SL86_9AGAM|nr:UbiA prenyltransferase [Artomyces pyxidatus]
MSQLTASSSIFRRWIELSRIHKFAGTILVFWPIAWGVTLSADSLSMPFPSYAFTVLYGFVAASFLRRTLALSLINISTGAGCIWDDIMDRNFDRQVGALLHPHHRLTTPPILTTHDPRPERTKRRPIADGRISVPGALVFLLGHIVVLFTMVWPFNDLAWTLGLVSALPLPGIYPLLKRVTYWPQAWLGIEMNISILVVSGALQNTITPAACAMLAGCWSWTLYYDSIYACQDKRDDVKAGVKSTAFLFGEHVKVVLAGFAVLFVACLAAAGYLNGQGTSFYLLSVGGAAVHLLKQMSGVDVDDVRSCLMAFNSNGWAFGGIVWFGLFADYALA